jgi:hypothetical protein
MATPLERLHSIVQQAYDLQQAPDDLLAKHAEALAEIDGTLDNISSAIEDDKAESFPVDLLGRDLP